MEWTKYNAFIKTAASSYSYMNLTKFAAGAYPYMNL